MRIRKRKSAIAASVSFCIQRKIANYLEESKELLTFAAEKIIAIMTAIQLRAELFREMNPMLENEAMLSKMLAFVKKLFAEQQAEMKVTDKKSYLS
jgi:TRAP-type mannitol/chloroaromatic compound transport system permease large subunit